LQPFKTVLIQTPTAILIPTAIQIQIRDGTRNAYIASYIGSTTAIILLSINALKDGDQKQTSRRK